MTSPLISFDHNDWQSILEQNLTEKATGVLENGQVLYFPKLAFHLNDTEKQLIQSNLKTGKRKNISYNPNTKTLSNQQNNPQDQQLLHHLLERYAVDSTHFIQQLLGPYVSELERGRTSLRINEAKNRETSIKKDDQRLHVDAFPSSPVGQKQILRIFSNINPFNQDRVWKVGEPFSQVAERFVPLCRRTFPGEAKLLKLLRITKTHRSEYDHYMLQIHDKMKADDNYQKSVTQHQIRFPSGSSWVVFTDVVSHAALAGQYMLEQTFYVPSKLITQKHCNPQFVLQKMINRNIFK